MCERGQSSGELGRITRASDVVALAQRFTHGDDDRCGARRLCQSSLRMSVEPTSEWRRGNCVAPSLVRDRGPPGTSRSPITGRASSGDDAARTQVVLLLDAPGLAGAFTPMRLSSAAPGYLNPGTREGSRTENTRAGVNPVHSGNGSSVAGSRPGQTPGERG